ncbi:hypothetical protein ABW19_dt0201783 [Dactylella cylindrospora]|nr:hypothetical protein ABW19_dt0201783 [Dactylella cylindrospora]
MRSVILFATPSHANIVADHTILSSIFDEACIDQGIGRRRGGLQAAAIVVDSLPRSTAVTGNRVEGWAAMITDRRTRFFGSSGPDYPDCLLESTTYLDKLASRASEGPDFRSGGSERHLDKDFNAPTAQSHNINDERGSLVIRFSRTEMPDEVKNNRPGRRENLRYPLHTFHRIKLSLANTLFQTGKPSTMVYHWKDYQPKTGSQEKSASRAVEVKDLTISLSHSLRFKSSVYLPLERLTKPRKIIAGNGNILKQLGTSTTPGDAEKDPFPASKELEAAVEKWFQTHPLYDPEALEKHPVAIFARVMEHPSSIPLDNLILGDNPPIVIKGKWRLLRVISGGGGWGNNAGLLALDPHGMGGEEGIQVPSEGPSNVGKIAGLLAVGSWIEFYIAVPPNKKAIEASSGFKFEVLDKDDDTIAYVPKDKLFEGNSGDSEASETKKPSETGTPVSRANGSGLAVEGGLWLSSRRLDIPGMQVVLELDQELDGDERVLSRNKDGQMTEVVRPNQKTVRETVSARYMGERIGTLSLNAELRREKYRELKKIVKGWFKNSDSEEAKRARELVKLLETGYPRSVTERRVIAVVLSDIHYAGQKVELGAEAEDLIEDGDMEKSGEKGRADDWQSQSPAYFRLKLADKARLNGLSSDGIEVEKKKASLTADEGQGAEKAEEKGREEAEPPTEAEEQVNEINIGEATEPTEVVKDAPPKEELVGQPEGQGKKNLEPQGLSKGEAVGEEQEQEKHKGFVIKPPKRQASKWEKRELPVDVTEQSKEMVESENASTPDAKVEGTETPEEEKKRKQERKEQKEKEKMEKKEKEKEKEKRQD